MAMMIVMVSGLLPLQAWPPLYGNLYLVCSLPRVADGKDPA